MQDAKEDFNAASVLLFTSHSVGALKISSSDPREKQLKTGTMRNVLFPPHPPHTIVNCIREDFFPHLDEDSHCSLVQEK